MSQNKTKETLEGKQRSHSPTYPPAKFILTSSSNDKTEYYKSLYSHQPPRASLRDRARQSEEM